MGPEIASVRQNLALLVDDGQLLGRPRRVGS
jgi:hypothetical protein